MEEDNWRKGIKDSKSYLENAKKGTNRVKMTNLIHAVIRANDALLLAYGKEKPERHPEAVTKFANLLKEKGLMDKYGKYEKVLATVLAEKNLAEYRGKEYKEEEVNSFYEKAKRFHNAVQELISRLEQ